MSQIDKKNKILTEVFSENDNSASLYKESLIEYLENTIKNTRFEAMSDYALYLSWFNDCIEEIIYILKK